MAVDTAVGASAAYPLRFEVEYPEKLSRLLIFVKWLLVLPHLIVLAVLGFVASVIGFFAFFAILFTEKYPRGLFDWVVNLNRWNANVAAYWGLLRDEYPPFSGERGSYPVTYELDYPEKLNRWLIFVKWLLVLPHAVILVALYIAIGVVWLIAFFAILLTGQFPRGMFDFVVGVTRWGYRVNAYEGLMRDEYPPFSLK